MFFLLVFMYDLFHYNKRNSKYGRFRVFMHLLEGSNSNILINPKYPHFQA